MAFAHRDIGAGPERTPQPSGRAKLISWPSGSSMWKYRSPQGVGGRHGRVQPGGQRPLVHGIDVVAVEDGPSPSGGHALDQLEVEETAHARVAGARRARPPVDGVEAEGHGEPARRTPVGAPEAHNNGRAT